MSAAWFGLLGPLEVGGHGRTVEIDSSRQRTVLATLLLSGGAPVPVDDLVEAVWPTGPPNTAHGTLQTHVSRLRSSLANVLPAGVTIEHGPAGYRLEVERGAVDVHQFDDLVDTAANAAPAQARRQLGAALALWRGDALVDFRYQPFAQLAIARLEERRVSATEDRIELDLGHTVDPRIVTELELLVALHPLRERLWAQLMTALYRLDRQVEALRAYARVRAVLTDELGVEPSTMLRDLERAILDQSFEPDPLNDTPPVLGESAPTPEPDARLRCARLLDRGHRLRRAGEFTGAAQAYSAAARLAESIGDSEALAVAALGIAGPPEDDYFEPLADQLLLQWLHRLASLDHVGPMVRARLAIDYMNRDETERALAMLDHAEAEARAGNDTRVLAYVLRARCRAWFAPSALEARITAADDLIAIGRALEDDEVEAWGHRWLYCHLLESGRVDEADREMGLLSAAAARLRDPFHEWAVSVRRAGRALMAGDLELAQGLLDESFALAAELGSVYVVTATGGVLGVLRYWQGRIDELLLMLELTGPRPAHAPDHLTAAARSWASLHAGRFDDARELCEEVLAHGVTDLLNRRASRSTFVVELTFLAEVAARFGDPICASIYDTLVPYQRTCATLHAGLTVVAPVDHPLAILAEALGRPHQADQHFALAAAAADAMRTPALLSRVQLDTGRVLQQRASATDRAAADGILRAAVDTADRLGLVGIAREARQLLSD